MKRIKCLLALLLMLCLLKAAPCAWGEEPTAAERGLEEIKTARNWDCIVLPEDWTAAGAFEYPQGGAVRVQV